VRDVKQARADYLALIGEKQLAVDAYDDTNKITVGMGGKIDVSFAKIRVGLAFADRAIIKSNIETAKTQVESGGDWERRNVACIYEAVYLLIARDFKGAAKLLLESVATFTCTKLFDYNSFVFVTVISALVCLDRVDLKEKVIQSPEILQVINEMPVLKSLLFSLYQCKYAAFFQALSDVSNDIKRNPYIAAHRGWFMREVRIVAYKQFLEAYRSVTLESMAKTFSVSVPFLDRELSRFISAGRLSCKIDKVGGTVESVRMDRKEAQYSDTIKQGDHLLNRVQKLTKFINY
jgi:26S proteasome regulatory subunit N7